MKPIVVKESNLERIAAELESVQKRCKARTVSVNDVFGIAQKLLAYYVKQTGSKKALDGCKFTVDWNNQDFPNAYKYVPESTILTFEYSSGTMKLIDICRDTTFTAKICVEAKLTQEAKDAILANVSTCEKYELERGIR